MSLLGQHDAWSLIRIGRGKHGILLLMASIGRCCGCCGLQIGLSCALAGASVVLAAVQVTYLCCLALCLQ